MRFDYELLSASSIREEQQRPHHTCTNQCHVVRCDMHLRGSHTELAITLGCLVCITITAWRRCGSSHCRRDFRPLIIHLNTLRFVSFCLAFPSTFSCSESIARIRRHAVTMTKTGFVRDCFRDCYAYLVSKSLQNAVHSQLRKHFCHIYVSKPLQKIEEEGRGRGGLSGMRPAVRLVLCT